MLFNKRPRLLERLLVVEDEPLVAFDNEHGLREAGYEVVATVDNVPEAVRVLEEEALDLVLLDINLHGEESGLDVAEAARDKGVPVLLVTAQPPADAAQYALGTLRKPYSEKALKNALAAVDGLLGGERPKKIDGLTLYAPVAG